MKDRKVYISYLISFILLALYSYIFFFNTIISIILAGLLSIKFHNIIYEILNISNIRQKRLMFREFLDLFNSSIISGNNFYNSLLYTSREIKNIFNEEKFIIKYLNELILDIDNGNSIEDSLLNFKKKSNLEDINIFIDSLIIALKSGIDISKITTISKDMISENISLELELSVISNNSKKEFIIMSILPLIILLVLSMTNSNNLSLIDYIIRMPVFILFIFSFYIGYQIVNLEV